MFKKKNRLITIIIIAMIVGITLGYAINKSITNNVAKVEQSYIKQSADIGGFSRFIFLPGSNKLTMTNPKLNANNVANVK